MKIIFVSKADEKRSKILKLLITYYEKAISDFPNKKKSIPSFLYKKRISQGICHCALQIFKTNIYHGKWVSNVSKKLNSKENSYWFERPSNDIPNAKFLLEQRVKVMKQIINKKKVSY